MKYRVYVDDNFHYQDKDERYLLGEYDTEEEALAAARGTVDAFLQREHRPGMTAEELYEHYVSFGEDPFILSERQGVGISAWEYAKRRSQEICG